MPPHRQPARLIDLTYEAIGKLVLTSCSNIDAKHTIGQREWHQQAAIIQSVLVVNVPPCDWDILCDAVFLLALRKYRVLKDCSVIYATLAHSNMKKLQLIPLCDSETSYKFYQTPDSDVDFYYEVTDVAPFYKMWYDLFTKLVNLKELDMKYVDNERIFQVVGTNCLQLESFTHRSATVNVVRLLNECKGLRFFKHAYGAARLFEEEYVRVQAKKALETFPQLEELCCANMAEVLETVSVPPPLNLRHFRQNNCSPLDISIMVPLCPHLQSLDIDPESIHSSDEIFNMLEASSLKLTHLVIRNFIFNSSTKRFFSNKGETIENVGILCFRGDLYEAVIHIGETCKNLAALKVNDWRDFHFAGGCPYLGNGPQPIVTADMFKCLTSFEYAQGRDSRIMILCLSKSSIVAHLAADGTCFIAGDMVTALNPAWLTELTTLAISNWVAEATVRHVYTNCPKLKSLHLNSYLNNETIRCIDIIREEILAKNYDLDIKYTEGKANRGPMSTVFYLPT